MTSNTLKYVGGVAAAYAGYRVGRAYLRRYSFEDKVAIVTGGSRGLGLNLTRRLLAAGAHVAICSRHEEELKVAAAEFRHLGGRLVWQVCDVTDNSQLAAFIEHVRSGLGPVDVLINNAGVIQVGPAECMTGADFQQAMAVHFWAPLAAMDLVIPEMVARHSGRIVNIASIGGEISVPHLLPYSASKFALVGLSQGLRAELANYGVYVTTVCPGLMRTGSHWHAWFKGKHRQECAWFSLGASAPLVAVDADRAARQILNACRWGEAQAMPSVLAHIGARFNALAPELTADLAQLAARLLPSAGGIGRRALEGRDSQSALFPSLATYLGDRAARENNELPVPSKAR